MLPRTGARLEVAIGYRETGLFDMGQNMVDKVEASGPPDTITVRAKAADMLATMKACRRQREG
ncbi:MAG: hypothetical protein U9R74_09720 [Pseudomonadota bacterium]|nr:hypothetical protein [Pseudomonadota bacterium]